MAKDSIHPNKPFAAISARVFNGLALTALAYLALRVCWVASVLLRHLPEGPAPVLRFLLIAAIICFAPGLGLLRLWRVRLPSLTNKLLLVLTLSLSASALLVWQLYFFGLYTKPIALAMLLLLGGFGLYGLQPAIASFSLANGRNRWNAMPAAQRLSLLIGLLFLQGLFETTVGAPMSDWDALVSWDKWTVDMAARNGLGQYLMGGYPQWQPALHSLFYKVAGTSADVLPAEHLLLHGFNVVYVAILILALWSLGRDLRLPWLLPATAYALHRGAFAFLANGYVDTPLAAFILATCAVIVAVKRGAMNWQGNTPAAVILFALLFFAVAFLKGNGLIWLPFLAVGLFLPPRRARRIALLSLGITALLVLPYFLHQHTYSQHPQLAETSPFLHAFSLQLTHARLFTANWAHLRAVTANFISACSLPIAPGLTLLAICVALVFAGFFQRRLALFALAGTTTLGIWFFTASYDLRNALASLLILMLVCAASLTRAKAGRWLGGALLAILVLLAPGAQIRQTLARPFRAFSPPRAWLLPTHQRHMALRPWGDIRNLLYDTPWGQPATHLWASSGLYRLLAPRGAYTMNDNSFNNVQPGDLLVDESLRSIPEGFTPIATLHKTGAATQLFIYQPAFRPVQADIRQLPDADTACIITITPAPSTPTSAPHSGIVAITLDSPAAGITLELAPDFARANPYAAYFSCARDHATLRLPFYAPESPDLPAPRFILRTANQPVRIRQAALYDF